MRVRIKVCGITTKEDAWKAADLGVDAIGFNFYPESPRYIPPEEAKKILLSLPPFLSGVGVFVNEHPQVVEDIARYCYLECVQLHGDEGTEYISLLNLPVIKAFRVGKDFSPASLLPYKEKVKAFLLDTYKEDIPGGTGETFNWSIAVKIKKEVCEPIILAGGLNPDNIKEAILQVKPYGVDIASGVEEKPGKKDPYLLKKFVERVREVENEIS